jgi:hypothetical protein
VDEADADQDHQSAGDLDGAQRLAKKWHREQFGEDGLSQQPRRDNGGRQMTQRIIDGEIGRHLGNQGRGDQVQISGRGVACERLTQNQTDDEEGHDAGRRRDLPRDE